MLSGLYHGLLVHLPLGFSVLAPVIYAWDRPDRTGGNRPLFVVWARLLLLTTTLVFLLGSPSSITIWLNEDRLEAAPKVLHGLSAALFWLACILLWYLTERVGRYHKVGITLVLWAAAICGYYGGRLVHG